MSSFNSSTSFFDLKWGTIEITSIIIYPLTALIALTGNIITVWVLTHGKKSKTELNKYLLNLSAADIILAVFCIPFTYTMVVFKRWIFGKVLCPLVLFLQCIGVVVGIFTNVAIGVDRLIAIKLPLRQRFTSTRSTITLLIIWISSTAIALPQLIVSRTFSMDMLQNDSNTLICRESWSESNRNAYTITILLSTYLIPLLILTVTYTMIGKSLWDRQLPGVALRSRDEIQLASRRKVIKLLISIVIAFALCWAPLNIFMIVNHIFPDSIPVTHNIYMIAYICVHWIAMFHSAINPFIYSFLSDAFRKDFKILVALTCPCCSCLKFQEDQRSTAFYQYRSYRGLQTSRISRETKSQLQTGCEKRLGKENVSDKFQSSLKSKVVNDTLL